MSSPPTNYPPGIATFRRAEERDLNGDYVYPELADQATALLYLVDDKKVLIQPAGSKKATELWKEVYATAFKGQKNSDGSHDNNGVFGGYQEWDCSNPASAKFRPLIIKMVEHFADSFKNKSPEESSVIEALASKMRSDISASEAAKEKKHNEKTQRANANIAIETGMGFRSPGQGVTLPSMAGPFTNSQVAAASVLGQPTQSTTLHEGTDLLFMHALLLFMINLTYLFLLQPIVAFTLS